MTVYGPKAASRQMPVVSFRIAGLDPAEAALKLDERFGILSRPGLHCAPAAHRTLGTAPTGTLRFSFGYFNTEAEIRTALDAVGRLRGGI